MKLHLLALGTALLCNCAGSYKPLKGWSIPFSAGSPVIHCYSRIMASEAEIRYALHLLWKRYPENRITAADVQAMSAYYNSNGYHYDTISRRTGKALTEEGVFESQIKGNYKTPRYSWGLKTANGKAICAMGVANVNQLCLSSVTLLPITKAGGNWQLTREERARAMTWFEEDILVKLKALILETRKAARKQS